MSVFSPTQLLIFLIGLAAAVICVITPLLKGNIKMINKIGLLGRKFVIFQLSEKTSTNLGQFQNSDMVRHASVFHGTFEYEY